MLPNLSPPLSLLLLLPLLTILLLLAPPASAQFNIFDQFFGGQQQAQQRQQQPHGHQRAGGSGPGHAASMWAAQADAVPCPAYLCPSTLVCVPSPAECPCPDVQDVKCLVPDAQSGQATVVCVRGGDGCERVQRLGRGV